MTWKVLFNNQATNGVSDVAITSGNRNFVYVRGDFGAGEIYLQFLSPTDEIEDWSVKLTDLSNQIVQITTPSLLQINKIPSGSRIRLSLENVTGIANITAVFWEG